MTLEYLSILLTSVTIGMLALISEAVFRRLAIICLRVGCLLESPDSPLPKRLLRCVEKDGEDLAPLFRLPSLLKNLELVRCLWTVRQRRWNGLQLKGFWKLSGYNRADTIVADTIAFTLKFCLIYEAGNLEKVNHCFLVLPGFSTLNNNRSHASSTSLRCYSCLYLIKYTTEI